MEVIGCFDKWVQSIHIHSNSNCRRMLKNKRALSVRFRATDLSPPDTCIDDVNVFESL